MTALLSALSDGRKLGYARVSTHDQRLDLQLDALTSAACDLVFQDHGVSGTRARRPGLDQLLEALAPGDTVVVFKLDRLGRSVLHLADLLVEFNGRDIHFCSLTEGINTATPGGKLIFHIFSAMAEFQRDIIAENTREGLAAAKRRGIQLGRPKLLSEDQISEAVERLDNNGISMTALAEEFSVSRMTLTRALQLFDEEDQVS